MENGQPPSEIADAAFDGIRSEQFYIWPGDEVDDIVRARFDHILKRSNPDRGRRLSRGRSSQRESIRTILSYRPR